MRVAYGVRGVSVISAVALASTTVPPVANVSLRVVDLLREASQISDAALHAGTMHPYIRTRTRAAALLGSALAMRAADAHQSPSQRQLDWRAACESHRRALNSLQALRSIWFEAIDEVAQTSDALERCGRMLPDERLSDANIAK